MNWAAALGTGFGLGLATFGGLWAGVRRLQERGASSFVMRRLARLGLVAITFYVLIQVGGVKAVTVGLIGLMVGRWYVIRAIGGKSDGQ